MKLFLDNLYTVYLFAGFFLISTLIKIIINIYYLVMVRASLDMQHTGMESLIKIKNRYIEECRKSFFIRNTNVFVEKHLYGVKILGVPCGFWDSFDTFLIICCFLSGCVLGYVAYETGYGYRESIVYIFYGIFAGFSIIMMNGLLNIQKKTERIKVNICDYLDNKLELLPKKNDIAEKTVKEDEILNEILNEYLI